MGGVPAPVLGAAHAGPRASALGAVQARALRHRLLQPDQAAADQGGAGHPDEAVLVEPDLTPALTLGHNHRRLF